MLSEKGLWYWPFHLHSNSQWQRHLHKLLAQGSLQGWPDFSNIPNCSLPHFLLSQHVLIFVRTSYMNTLCHSLPHPLPIAHIAPRFPTQTLLFNYYCYTSIYIYINMCVYNLLNLFSNTQMYLCPGPITWAQITYTALKESDLPFSTAIGSLSRNGKLLFATDGAKDRDNWSKFKGIRVPKPQMTHLQNKPHT